MKQQQLSLAIIAALSAFSLQAETANNANTDASDIERMVVVSSRVETPVREIATSVSLVTKEDIELRGYASLAEILRVQPAIHADNSGGIGSATAIRIRGEEAYRTLIRIDGVDISDPTGPQVQPQFGQQQSSNINRIEILRGPQGLMYGADSGGVINIESGYAQDGLSGSVSAESGRFDTRNLQADVGGTNGKFDFYLSASDYSTEGFNSRVDDTIGDADGYDNTTVHARLGVQATDDLKLSLVVRNNEGDGEYDDCFTAAFSPSNDCASQFEQLNTRLSADYQLENGNHQVAYAKTDIEREFLTEGASTFLSKGELERAEYIGDNQINDYLRLVYGVDWEKEVISSNDQSRTQTGYYLEAQGQLDDAIFVTAGLRRDENDDFGDHTSFRISAAYLYALGNDEVKFRSAYGTGFRAPSLFEIDYNQGPFAFPPASDTNLKEETSEGYELGVEYLLANGSSYQVVYFNQDVKDAIFFDLAGFSGYLQGDGESTSKGIEVIADTVLTDNLRMTANYTYNDTSDTSGVQRIRRPEHLANIGLNYQFNALQLAGHLRWVDGIVDAGVELDSYQVIDVSARYQFTEQLTGFARVENALDEDYQDITAFNTPGAAVHAGVKFQF